MAILRRKRAGTAVKPGAVRVAPSARARILGWYVLLVAFTLLAGLFVQRTVLRAQLDDDVNTALNQEADELAQLTTGRDPNTGEPFGTDIEAIFDTFLARNIPVKDEALFTLVNGAPHASTLTPVQLLDEPEVVAAWAALSDTTRAEIDTSAGKVRYLAVPLEGDGGMTGTFVAAVFLDERRGEIDDLMRDSAIVLGGIFIAGSAVAWFAAGRILRPVRLLTQTARSITDSDLSRRIPVEGDDEIAELARTFNEMLDRLQTAFDTQRRFADDAGHELRTPITIVRGHLELLGDGRAERAETMHLVMDELDRMARIVDDLLVLARSEEPDFLDVQPVDVADLTRDIVSKAGAIADRRWLCDAAAEVSVKADRHRLTQALINLARNAAEHSPAGSEVRIGSRADDTRVVFWVRDQGEGIAPADQERIFERFARLNGGRRKSGGAGLGLAIVRAIATAHGGTATVESAHGAGATFYLSIPLSSGTAGPA